MPPSGLGPPSTKSACWVGSGPGRSPFRAENSSAVVGRPPLLLADEPTANLDEGYAGDIMDMFRAFNQVGVTVILTTHDQDLIHRYGGRGIALSGGKLVK
jgi:ABC-type ATPase involved in cell division